MHKPPHISLLLCIMIFALCSCHKSVNQDVVTLQPGGNENGSGDTTTSIEYIAPPSFKPNIILILGDDVGYEIPTCNGGQSYYTPNIDMMAQNGMRFTQCHSSPLCSPSRFMLLTGKYNFRNYNQWGVMSQSQKTIANMLKDAGYATYIAGKWQLDGGDKSIHTFGFDDYCVLNPYETDPDHPNWRRYKDPDIFVNGNYLSRNLTKGKYSEDIFTDSIFNFISANVEDPFFVCYSMSLAHGPFYPTPDDPEFAAWKPGNDKSDRKFFPSMITYMDKKIGQVIEKVQQLGIAEKTIIIYAGDNGTDNTITSQFNNQVIRGGKGSTNEYGTHVPMMALWPSVIKPGTRNDDLVDFTDFMPTLAHLAKVETPATYGTLDGTSFYMRLFRNPGKPRQWIFCHYNPYRNSSDVLKRWIQNKDYKLYDPSNNFYNLVSDINEMRSITGSQQTASEAGLIQNFRSAVDSLH